MSDTTTNSEPQVQDSAPATSSPAPESAPAAEPTSASPSSSEPTAPSPPSGDTPRSDRDGLLAAVLEVVRPKQDSGEATVPGQQDTDVAGKTGDTVPGTPSESAQQTPEPQATEQTDPTEAELKRLKPETRKRFERLLQQRDEARTAYSQVEPELAQHRQLTGYLKEHQLAPDDVNMLLGVGAHLRKGDFQSFLNGVMPYVQAAQEALGQRLPPDLQQQVDEGLVSESAARELSQTRFRAIQAENQIKAVTEQRGQQDTENRVTAVRQTIDAWEQDIRRRDPDYPVKAAAVRRIGQALLQERGVPQTPDAARELVQAAYDEATTMLLKARPAPQATRKTPSGILGTTASAAEPRTMKDAALMALEGMRRAS